MEMVDQQKERRCSTTEAIPAGMEEEELEEFDQPLHLKIGSHNFKNRKSVRIENQFGICPS